MKKLLLLFMLLIPFSLKAQVHWGDEIIAGYRVDVGLVSSGDGACLTVKYKVDSEKKAISDSPKLLLRLTDGTVLSLEGRLGSISKGSDGGVMVGNIFVSDSNTSSQASFMLTREQAESFQQGIIKFRLSTNGKKPLEKSWTKDKIGKKLYEQYQKSLNFEEGF